MSKMQQLILELAATGMTNQQVADEVRRRHPNAKTSAASVASVKSRSKGAPAPQQSFPTVREALQPSPAVALAGRVGSSGLETLRARANEVLATAARMYDMPQLFEVRLEFNLRGRSAGQACYTRNCITGSIVKGSMRLRLNLEAFKLAPQDTLEDTIPHEVAHLVAEQEGRHAHDAYWRRIAVSLGSTGKRCHSLPLKPANGGHVYRVNGQDVIVGAQVHRKIQAGQRRVLRKSRVSFGRDNYVGRA